MIARPFGALGRRNVWRLARQQQAHAGALPVRRIEQFDAAAVFFENLCDDREAEAGAAFARRSCRVRAGGRGSRPESPCRCR
jgi:hypothetical protein